MSKYKNKNGWNKDSDGRYDLFLDGVKSGLATIFDTKTQKWFVFNGEIRVGTGNKEIEEAKMAAGAFAYELKVVANQ